jgi:hypothetical protein
MRNEFDIFVRNLKGRDHMESLAVDELWGGCGLDSCGSG